MAKSLEAIRRRACATRASGARFSAADRERRNLHRALAVQQNVFLHLFSVKMRRRR